MFGKNHSVYQPSGKKSDILKPINMHSGICSANTIDLNARLEVFINHINGLSEREFNTFMVNIDSFSYIADEYEQGRTPILRGEEGLKEYKPF